MINWQSTLRSFYRCGTASLALRPHSYPHAFATVECVQIGIVALLAVGAAALPRFTQASADAPVIDS